MDLTEVPIVQLFRKASYLEYEASGTASPEIKKTRLYKKYFGKKPEAFESAFAMAIDIRVLTAAKFFEDVANEYEGMNTEMEDFFRDLSKMFLKDFAESATGQFFEKFVDGYPDGN